MTKKNTRKLGGEYSLAEGIAKVGTPLTHPPFCFLTWSSITAPPLPPTPPPHRAVFSKERVGDEEEWPPNFLNGFPDLTFGVLTLMTLMLLMMFQGEKAKERRT